MVNTLLILLESHAILHDKSNTHFTSLHQLNGKLSSSYRKLREKNKKKKKKEVDKKNRRTRDRRKRKKNTIESMDENIALIAFLRTMRKILLVSLHFPKHGSLCTFCMLYKDHMG